MTRIATTLSSQTFHVTQPDAKSILLAGDFTAWQERAIKMQKGCDGTWTTTVKLPPGAHNYLFIVDGEWRDDPECTMRVPNPYGGYNMVRQVPSIAGDPNQIITDDEIKAGIQRILNHCRQLTLQLTRLSDTREPVGVASGFFISVDGSTYLLSAGHALGKNGWTIETTFTIEDKGITACIPINGPWTLKKLSTKSLKLQEVDVAWAKIDLAAFQKTVLDDKRLKGMNFEYLVYQGPMEDTPDGGEPHAYAAANKVLLFDAPKGRYMEREYSYECEMEYKGTREDGLYVFSVPQHKGHDYYRGASGSPIVEPTGTVVAILVQGCETKNELYGFPTKGIVDLIRIGIDAERRGSNPLVQSEQ